MEGGSGRFVPQWVRGGQRHFGGGRSVGIRETLNKNPIITTGATVGVILLALGVIVWEVMPSHGPRAPTKAFYSVDDGATYFPDDINKIPPIDHEGKADAAVRCYVYSCSGKGKFVAYLEKYTKKMRDKMLQARSSPNGPMDGTDTDLGRLVKRPGDSKWTPAESVAGQQITDVKCPDNSGAIVTPEFP
jgi:hypothetical protein